MIALLFVGPALRGQEEDNRSGVVQFTNSESPDLSFIVHTDMKTCSLQVTTNYPETFKIRFIDYWGNSVKVYRNLQSGSPVDISEFRNQVVVLNIVDSKTGKLLSSQVVNLKRRNYWKE